MGRPRYTSPAEQIVWLEHHVEELEAENQKLYDKAIEEYEELAAENQRLSDELGTLKAWMKRKTCYTAGLPHQTVWSAICREYPYLAGNVDKNS